MTTLKKWVSPRTSEVRRIYIERQGLKAKLWLEKANTPQGFEVHYYGNTGDFTAKSLAGETIQMSEALEALADVGLDIKRCQWSDIVAKAQ